jgi:hypothetical protein
VKRAMAVVLFLVVMAFVIRAPGQSLGEGIGQAASNVGTFFSRVATMEERP